MISPNSRGCPVLALLGRELTTHPWICPLKRACRRLAASSPMRSPSLLLPEYRLRIVDRLSAGQRLIKRDARCRAPERTLCWHCKRRSAWTMTPLPARSARRPGRGSFPSTRNSPLLCGLLRQCKDDPVPAVSAAMMATGICSRECRCLDCPPKQYRLGCRCR
jgi:hypothetical protein